MRQTTQHERAGFTAVAVSGGVLAVGLLATAASVPMAWMVWPLGYGFVLPLAIAYAARSETASGEDERRDPLSDLQERYVEGDVDERQFEAELEAVLAEEDDG